MSATEIFLTGAAAIAVTAGITEGLARIAHSSFLSTVLIGKDNRTSTSKTFVFLWTLLIGWALVCLLIAGEFITVHGCAALPDIGTAIKACRAQQDQTGLLQTGWQQFATAGLSGGYALLLGMPAAAAVAAKGITQAKKDSGKDRTPNAPPGQKLSARLAQVFSADDQTTDIGDFQYVIFNLVTGAYFIAQFVHPNGEGLPEMPPTLLGLTSISAALYLGKKAATTNRPMITGVFPSTVRPGEQITVTGNGLTADPNTLPQPPGLLAPRIAINGISLQSAKPDTSVPGRLTATVPPDLVPDGTPTPAPGTVQVVNVYGAITDTYPVQLLETTGKNQHNSGSSDS